MATSAATVAALLGDEVSEGEQIVCRMRRLVLLALRRRPLIHARSVLTRADLLAAMPCRWRGRVAGLLSGLLQVMHRRGELRLLTADYVTCYGTIRRHAVPTWIAPPVGGPVLVARLAQRGSRTAVAAWRQKHPDGIVVGHDHAADATAPGAA